VSPLSFSGRYHVVNNNRACVGDIVGDVSNADPCPLAANGKDHIPIIVANLQLLVTARAAGMYVYYTFMLFVGWMPINDLTQR
jgi:hypothetical protein